MGKRKLILRNFLSPGDIVLLTAAVRELHQAHPGQFLTDVRTSCPELWEHNPHLTPLRIDDPGVELIDCEYPLVHRCNEAPYHSIHGFTHFLSERLGLHLQPIQFRGDICLSLEERSWKSAVHELAGIDLPFWIVNAGGKFDFTIKWWDADRYQRVIDQFRGRILFVQVGELGHFHPPLRNVIDLRGKTDLRELVRLVYHSNGVLCGVTALMHLAAAVPTRPDRPPARAAVVVAGGREPAHWQAYPQHQFIHTIGALPCCANGGCWRSRTKALGDGDDADRSDRLCQNLAGHLPRCMDLITAEEVIRRIELYLAGGAGGDLRRRQMTPARRAIARSRLGPRFDSTVNLQTAPGELSQAARTALLRRPPPMRGRGVLVVAPHEEDLPAALETVKAMRNGDCTLPIECWASGPCRRHGLKHFEAMDAELKFASHDVGVTVPMSSMELRMHALATTGLRDVLMVGAGTIPRCALDRIFHWREFSRLGALLTRGERGTARPGFWKLCGLAMPRHEASDEFMLIDRMRCWPAIQLWRWIGERMYFFSSYVGGSGGAVQLAMQAMNLRPALSLRLGQAFCRQTNRAGSRPGPASEHRHERARP